jgi:hypothetical protein
MRDTVLSFLFIIAGLILAYFNAYSAMLQLPEEGWEAILVYVVGVVAGMTFFARGVFLIGGRD